MSDGKILAVVKIQRGIFQSEALSSLLFLVMMMPLRKCVGEYKLSKLQERINHLMYRTISNCLPKMKKIGYPQTGSEDIQSRYWNGIGLRKMRHDNYEKRETTHGGRNGTTKSRKNQNLQRKRYLKILCNIGSRHHQTSGDKRKRIKKCISGKRESFIESKLYSRNLIKGINTWAVLLVR